MLSAVPKVYPLKDQAAFPKQVSFSTTGEKSTKQLNQIPAEVKK